MPSWHTAPCPAPGEGRKKSKCIYVASGTHMGQKQKWVLGMSGWRERAHAAGHSAHGIVFYSLSQPITLISAGGLALLALLPGTGCNFHAKQ